MRTLLCILFIMVVTMSYAGELHRRDAHEYIKRHEGLKLQLYKDASGKLCIGWGHNIQDLGISREIAELLFEKDFGRAYREAVDHIPCFKRLDEVRQLAIIDMTFNLGIGGILGFKKMLRALEMGKWEEAAQEVLNSKYARQCPQRARDNAYLIRTGKLK